MASVHILSQFYFVQYPRIIYGYGFVIIVDDRFLDQQDKAGY
jgi:hypothetical protein